MVAGGWEQCGLASDLMGAVFPLGMMKILKLDKGDGCKTL